MRTTPTPDEITPTVLVTQKELKLSLVVAGSAKDTALIGHHTTELAYPARYIFPGELLLTNGLWLPERSAADWIADVKSAGLPAVAFGLNETYPTIPEDVVRACRELDIALIAVPIDVSFSQITDVLQSAGVPLEAVRLYLNRLREIGKQLTATSNQAELTQLIYRETGLDCWLVAAGGRCIAGTASPPKRNLLRRAVRMSTSGHVFALLGDGLSSFAAGRGRRSDLTLVVDAVLKNISDESRWIIETVMPHFLLEHAEYRARANTRRVLLRELLELTWTGNVAVEMFDARMRAIGLDPQSPVTVIASASTFEDLADAVAACDLEGVCSDYDGTQVVVVHSNSDQALDELAGVIRESNQDPVLGSGGPGIGVKGLRRSLAQALSSYRSAFSRKPGMRIVREHDVGTYSGLLHFVDQNVLEAFHDALIAPIIDWDNKNNGELRNSLQVFLQNDGKWRQASRELHIHHNTLKYRIQKVAALTGRDLTEVDSRIDFALALSLPSPANNPADTV